MTKRKRHARRLKEPHITADPDYEPPNELSEDDFTTSNPGTYERKVEYLKRVESGKPIFHEKDNNQHKLKDD